MIPMLSNRLSRMGKPPLQDAGVVSPSALSEVRRFRLLDAGNPPDAGDRRGPLRRRHPWRWGRVAGAVAGVAGPRSDGPPGLRPPLRGEGGPGAGRDGEGGGRRGALTPPPSPPHG